MSQPPLVDPAFRRRALLVEARRKRNMWVESARDGSGPLIETTTSKRSGSGATEKSSDASYKRQDMALDLLVERWAGSA